MRLGLLAGLAAGWLAVSAAAETAPPVPGPLPFPIQIDVAFDLVDQTGQRVTEADFRGMPMVLFFGYANCESICTVALPNIGGAMELLGDRGDAVTPVMITIDPEHDTPEALATAMPRYHARMTGLTGSPEALGAAWARFQVQVTEVARDPAGLPIFAHGSFIYLIDGDGNMKSLLPPITGPERIAELIERHLLDEGAPRS